MNLFLWVETFPPAGRWESLRVTRATSSVPPLLPLPSPVRLYKHSQGKRHSQQPLPATVRRAQGMMQFPSVMLPWAFLGWAFG